MYQYAVVALKHKWYVAQACRKTGAPLHLALIHDISKFYPKEYSLYQYEFFGEKTRDRNKPVTKSRARRAFKMHWRRNKHHWHYWVTDWHEDGVALKMPEKYVREMIADWLGASRAYAGTWNISKWFNRHFHEAILHIETRELVYNILAEQGYAVFDPKHFPGKKFPAGMDVSKSLAMDALSYGMLVKYDKRYIDYNNDRKWIVCCRREELFLYFTETARDIIYGGEDGFRAFNSRRENPLCLSAEEKE